MKEGVPLHFLWYKLKVHQDGERTWKRGSVFVHV